MYKPEPKSLETLQAERKAVEFKLINGRHLDSVAVRRLQNMYLALTKQIEELKREEVSSGN